MTAVCLKPPCTTTVHAQLRFGGLRWPENFILFWSKPLTPKTLRFHFITSPMASKNRNAYPPPSPRRQRALLHRRLVPQSPKFRKRASKPRLLLALPWHLSFELLRQQWAAQLTLLSSQIQVKPRRLLPLLHRQRRMQQRKLRPRT